MVKGEKREGLRKKRLREVRISERRGNGVYIMARKRSVNGFKKRGQDESMRKGNESREGELKTN